MRKPCVVAVCVMSLLLLIGLGLPGQSLAADERLAIGTASTGGTWYPLGGGVANMINKYVKGYHAAAHPSGASIENIRAVARKQDALALSMPDTAFYAYNSLDAFANKPVKEIRGLMSTYPIDIQFFALAKSNIKTITDLKGKKVAVG
ncbi:MAG: TAXI family TRAP transporter solute-binding subunit, partial [Desulfobacteraceae bacterium]